MFCRSEGVHRCPGGTYSRLAAGSSEWAHYRVERGLVDAEVYREHPVVAAYRDNVVPLDKKE